MVQRANRKKAPVFSVGGSRHSTGEI